MTSYTPQPFEPHEPSPSQRTLVVGNRRRWSSEGRITSSLRDFTFLDFSELTAAALATHAPDIILSPLVGDDFDVIEVATILASLEFKGRYRVIAEVLPNAELVIKEVSESAPALDFDVLLMAPNPKEKALRDVSDRS